MSLKISNRATPKQIATLKSLEYIGKWDLSVDEAAEIITELFEERRLALKQEEEDPWGGDDYTEAQYNSDRNNNEWKV